MKSVGRIGCQQTEDVETLFDLSHACAGPTEGRPGLRAAGGLTVNVGYKRQVVHSHLRSVLPTIHVFVEEQMEQKCRM